MWLTDYHVHAPALGFVDAIIILPHPPSEDRYGPAKDYIPHFCARTPLAPRTDHRFHGPPGTHVQVRLPPPLMRARLTEREG